MPLASRLRHTVTIRRPTVVVDPVTQEPIEDDWGQTQRDWSDVATVRAWVQPVTPQEMREASNAGAVVSTHKIFTEAVDLRQSDRIAHAGVEYEVDSVHNPANKDHHLEVMVHGVSG